MHKRDVFVFWLACALGLFSGPAAAQGVPETQGSGAAEMLAPSGLRTISLWPATPTRQTGENAVLGPVWPVADFTTTQGARSQPQPAYTPITGRQRLGWIAEGIAGPLSLGVGVLSATLETAFNTPEEWERSASGWGKRYLQREADVAISTTIEAGLGALWGEEPRYIPSQRRGFWPRTRYAMKTVILAQRRDGHLAPAWGRVAGNIVNNLIENTWLPPSVTTGGQTTLRSAQGFGGRAIGNFWSEFWPEIRRRLHR